MSRTTLLSAAIGAALLFVAPLASAQTCSTAAWSAVAGGASAATPPGNGRYSGRCALITSAAGQFVTDNSPTAEPSYRARFYVFTGTLNGDVFTAHSADNGGGNEIIGVSYNGTNLVFRVRGTASTITIPATAARWYGVEVRWNAAASSTFTAIVRGNNAASPTTQSITGISNAADRIDSIRLGQLTGAGAGRFDEFDSRRTTDIGFLLKGDANGNGSVTIGDAVVVATESGGGALAVGQPDCNENGSVTIGDATCIASSI